MEIKEYKSPKIEIVDLEIEGSLCASKEESLLLSNEDYNDGWDD